MSETIAKSETYSQMRARHSKEMNEFPMAFAFSKEQFEKAKEKLGESDKTKLRSVGGGGIMKATDCKAYHEMGLRWVKEQEEAIKNDAFVKEMFRYELGNHEYGYTWDKGPTLEACGFDEDPDKLDDRMKKLFAESVREFVDSMPEDY